MIPIPCLSSLARSVKVINIMTTYSSKSYKLRDIHSVRSTTWNTGFCLCENKGTDQLWLIRAFVQKFKSLDILSDCPAWFVLDLVEAHKDRSSQNEAQLFSLSQTSKGAILVKANQDHGVSPLWINLFQSFIIKCVWEIKKKKRQWLGIRYRISSLNG